MEEEKEEIRKNGGGGGGGITDSSRPLHRHCRVSSPTLRTAPPACHLPWSSRLVSSRTISLCQVRVGSDTWGRGRLVTSRTISLCQVRVGSDTWGRGGVCAGGGHHDLRRRHCVPGNRHQAARCSGLGNDAEFLRPPLHIGIEWTKTETHLGSHAPIHTQRHPISHHELRLPGDYLELRWRKCCQLRENIVYES
ncbi:uncharacterized protein LOC135093740 isoform X2 [Scylla paramamosain]|uniref:uncharacterized protein LOC135093740 isoform X2 n=1 Tax=Scylla paramamosain TaxID=85552 RepID=UPI00308330A2